MGQLAARNHPRNEKEATRSETFPFSDKSALAAWDDCFLGIYDHRQIADTYPLEKCRIYFFAGWRQ
jgi:hypothetical protein